MIKEEQRKEKTNQRKGNAENHDTSIYSGKKDLWKILKEMLLTKCLERDSARHKAQYVIM